MIIIIIIIIITIIGGGGGGGGNPLLHCIHAHLLESSPERLQARPPHRPLLHLRRRPVPSPRRRSRSRRSPRPADDGGGAQQALPARRVR